MNFGDSTALHHLRLPCEYWFRTISTIHHELTSLCFNVSFFAFTQLLFPVAHKCSPTTLAVPCAGGRIRFMSDLHLSLPAVPSSLCLTCPSAFHLQAQALTDCPRAMKWLKYRYARPRYPLAMFQLHDCRPDYLAPPRFQIPNSALVSTAEDSACASGRKARSAFVPPSKHTTAEVLLRAAKRCRRQGEGAGTKIHRCVYDVYEVKSMPNVQVL